MRSGTSSPSATRDSTVRFETLNRSATLVTSRSRLDLSTRSDKRTTTLSATASASLSRLPASSSAGGWGLETELSPCRSGCRVPSPGAELSASACWERGRCSLTSAPGEVGEHRGGVLPDPEVLRPFRRVASLPVLRIVRHRPRCPELLHKAGNAGLPAHCEDLPDPC